MIERIWDITLTVSNMKRAVDFYEKVLGLQKKYECSRGYGAELSRTGYSLITPIKS